YDLKDESQVQALTELVNSDNVPVGVRIKSGDKEGFSFGYALPRNHPTSQQYLLNFRDYNTSGKTVADQIRLSKKLYENEGIVGTVIDNYVDLSMADIKFRKVKNKDLQKILDYMFKNVNKGNNNISKGIPSLMRHCAKDFYLCGNVFPYIKFKAQSIGNSNKTWRFPQTIVTIDPEIIDIPAESIQFGNKQMIIRFSSLFAGKRFENVKHKQYTLDSLPTKIRNKVKKQEDIVLDPRQVYHMKRRGSTYSGWG